MLFIGCVRDVIFQTLHFRITITAPHLTLSFCKPIFISFSFLKMQVPMHAADERGRAHKGAGRHGEDVIEQH